jgi:Fur family ferric uptake transcriptional regulator
LTEAKALLYDWMRMKINRNHGTGIQPATPQRRLLFSVMQEAGRHVDAKELYRRASERDINISLATVYRNLRLFKEQGLIDERHLGQMHCCFYEMKGSGEHHHLICRGCGQIIEFASPLIHKLLAEMQRKNGFRVTRVELCLEGYCRECEKKGK